jgi:predicted AlkP superfamily phosphohydrolase/phosphomutase
MRGVRSLCLAAALLAAVACTPTPGTITQRLVVLAVDGMDPEMTERLIRQGRAPHLADLARVSGVVRVTSTAGAESASAWASFATGVNAGKHGVFDLVAPDLSTGRPRAATLEARSSEKWLGRWWSEGAAYRPVLGAEPFWTRLGRSGARARVLFVPGTFPPEPIPGGTLIAGTPLPDWAGGFGSGYTWLASDVPPEQVGTTRYGGRVERLSFSRNIARATLVGIRAPERLDLPLTITWNPEARSANIDIADQSVYLAEGQRSRWLEISVPLNLLTRIRGLVQLQLVKAGNDVQLYVSPVQWHPAAPPSPISAPDSAARRLFDRLGAYRTLVWPEAGWALADGWLSEASFLAAQDDTFSDRAEALLNRVDSSDWNVIVAGIESLDTTGRLMWRFIDPGHPAHDSALAPKFADAIEGMYLRLDELVGQIRTRLPDGTALAVVSPYGLYTARHVVDLNRWLATEGLLAWHTPPRPVTLAAMADPTLWDDTIDWTKTTARAMGAGHIYVNLRGRDPAGIVEPGLAYDAVLQRLRERLELLTDPISGRRVVARVRFGRELFDGAHAGRAPDLVVTFSPGYRASWDSMLGGASAVVIERNRERWSAEHASVEERSVPGVWLSSVALSRSEIHLLDVAPTILDYFRQAVPEGLDGISRLGGPEARPPG